MISNSLRNTLRQFIEFQRGKIYDIIMHFVDTIIKGFPMLWRIVQDKTLGFQKIKFQQHIVDSAKTVSLRCQCAEDPFKSNPLVRQIH